MTTLDLDDIQGLILRGYHKDVALPPRTADRGTRVASACCSPNLIEEEDPETGPFITVAVGLERQAAGGRACDALRQPRLHVRRHEDARAGRSSTSFPGGVPGGRRRARRGMCGRDRRNHPTSGSRSCVGDRTYTRSFRCTPTIPTSWRCALRPRRADGGIDAEELWPFPTPTSSTAARASSTSATRTACRSRRSTASSRRSGSTIPSTACRPASSCSGSRRSRARPVGDDARARPTTGASPRSA